jgi:hypothetical protein
VSDADVQLLRAYAAANIEEMRQIGSAADLLKKNDPNKNN